MSTRFFTAALAALVLAGCNRDVTGPASRPAAPSFSVGGVAGAVFTMSNATSGNAVLAFARAADGTLSPAGSYATGGLGTGAGGSTQGALALDGRWLLASNGGSNDVTVFRVDGTMLTMTDRVSSGGMAPLSIAVRNGLVYVLNTGGSGNITGFRLSSAGKLAMIPGSTRGLGGSAVGPAQVSFTPTGSALLVTEKAANQLASYTVDDSGLATGPMLHASAGMTPFGFAFRRDGVVVVSEVGNGAGGSTASSYGVGRRGVVELVSGAVPDFQTAACWAVLSRNGRYAYIVNAATSTLSGYSVASNGTLTLLNANGVTATTAAHPLDSAVSDGGQYLYSLATMGQAISGFAIAANGSLASIGNFAGVPASAMGLVAR